MGSRHFKRFLFHASFAACAVAIVGLSTYTTAVYADFPELGEAANLSVFGSGRPSSDLLDDVLKAASDYERMLPDQIFGSIDSSTAIYGNGGTNVVEIQSIELERLESIRFVGGPDDIWIVNVLGGFDLMDGAWISSVPPGNLLLNLVGDNGGTAAAASAGSVVNGILLGADRYISAQGSSGPVIGGLSDEIRISSGPATTADSFPVFAEPNDLTGDGKGDLVRRNTSTGWVSLWEMDGNLKTYHDIGPLDPNVEIVGIADLTGDGQGDVVRRNTVNGWVSLWEMDGHLKTFHNVGPLSVDVDIVGVADLTGDGMADIVRRNANNGWVSLWEMDGHLTTFHNIGPLSLDVEIVGVADLTGDGMADIVRRNVSNGWVSLWEMDGHLKTYHNIGPLDPDVAIVGLADLTGDGKADIVRRSSVTGWVSLWEMNGNLTTFHNIGPLALNKEIVKVLDVNDDDMADLVIRNMDTGYVSLWQMDGNVATYYPIGPLDPAVEIQPPLTEDEPSPPVTANDDTIWWAPSDQPRIYDVLANDTPTGTLSIGSLSSSAHGEVTLLPDNTIEYRQDGLAKESAGLDLYKLKCRHCHAVSGFTGTDTFTYTATNGANTDNATVTVKVQSFDTSYTATDLSGYPMSVCADIASDHSDCKGLTDSEIAAIGRFLVEVFP